MATSLQTRSPVLLEVRKEREARKTHEAPDEQDGEGESTLEGALEYMTSLSFYLMPIGFVAKAVLSITDIVTDLLVTVQWWKGGPLYRTWAIAATVILSLSFFYSTYKALLMYEDTSEFKSTLDIWGLYKKNKRPLRAVLILFQLQHIITCIVEARLWYRAKQQCHGLGTLCAANRARARSKRSNSIVPLPSQDSISVCKGDPDSPRSTREEEAVAALADTLEKLDIVGSESAWWKAYETIFEAIPQLILQCYVCLLTRSISPLNMLSISISLMTVAWSNLAWVHNAVIGFSWWNIVMTDNKVRLICLYLFFLGSTGLRATTIAGLAVAQPNWITWTYITVCFISNLVIVWFCIYTPREKEGAALDVRVFGKVTDLYTARGNMVGYSLSNLLAPGPGLAAWGWKWEHRHFCVLFNVGWRFVEYWAGAALLLGLPATNPCDPAKGTFRYMDVGCNGCCRGPVYTTEIISLLATFSATYVIGFAVWWPDQARFLSSLPMWTLEPASKPEPLPAMQRIASLTRPGAGQPGIRNAHKFQDVATVLRNLAFMAQMTQNAR